MKSPAQGLAWREQLEHQKQLLFSDKKKISLSIVMELKCTLNSVKGGG